MAGGEEGDTQGHGVWVGRGFEGDEEAGCSLSA